MENNDHSLYAALARLEERLSHVQLAQSAQSASFANWLEQIDKRYVRMERYLRVEVAVFGLIGVVMTALLSWAMVRILATL